MDMQAEGMQEKLLSEGMQLLESALAIFMEVKNEIGVDLSGKVYKAIRAYEKHIEKQLKAKE